MLQRRKFTISALDRLYPREDEKLLNQLRCSIKQQQPRVAMQIDARHPKYLVPPAEAVSEGRRLGCLT